MLIKYGYVYEIYIYYWPSNILWYLKNIYFIDWCNKLLRTRQGMSIVKLFWLFFNFKKDFKNIMNLYQFLGIETLQVMKLILHRNWQSKLLCCFFHFSKIYIVLFLAMFTHFVSLINILSCFHMNIIYLFWDLNCLCNCSFIGHVFS